MLTQKEIEYSVWRVSQATGMSEEEVRGYVMSTDDFDPRVFPNGVRMYLQENNEPLNMPKEDYSSLQALVEYEAHLEKGKERFWPMFREFFGLYPWWRELGPQPKDAPNVFEETAPGWWWLLDEPFEPDPYPGWTVLIEDPDEPFEPETQYPFPIGESGTVDPYLPRNFGSYYATHEELPYSRWTTTRRK